MAVVISGASDFEAFGPVPASVLHPWLAFGEQATTDSELHALVRAIEAVEWDWRAAWNDTEARWWLQARLPECVHHTLGEFEEMGRNLRRASDTWWKAGDWLRESGDPCKASVYQTLSQHVLVQQQRLEQQLEHLRMRVVWLCQGAGIALEAVPDLSEGAGDGCNA